MTLSPKKINLFLLYKLPSAYLTGVRVKSITAHICETEVKLRWINQNPFNSMFWAVQGMAAELSTGAMVMVKIKGQPARISMLVTSNKAVFSKKAKGRITFKCTDGAMVDSAIKSAMETKEGQTLWMKSEGRDAEGNLVSTFHFEWSIKVK